jgi:hypothetical protein
MRNIISAEPKPQEPQASQKPQAASDGKSIASLVLGILGITALPVICSIPAIAFGRASIVNAYKRGERGNGIAAAGTILGWIGLMTPLIIGVIVAVPWLGLLAAFVLAGVSAWGIYDTLRLMRNSL